MLILPLSTSEFPADESEAMASSAIAQVPVAVFIGERILICPVPATEADEIFDVRDRVHRLPNATEAPDVSKAINPRKLKVRDDFGFTTSWKAS
ncbi:hypothetical protein ABIB73_007492 [Bradyrhizobium sp. F1.4.3]|uniref:hypothetical protein n=1 Tax=Bradyrhizobium sp. F1.4.3 TaxID=3156356 RepID=UPI0033973A1B